MELMSDDSVVGVPLRQDGERERQECSIGYIGIETNKLSGVMRYSYFLVQFHSLRYHIFSFVFVCLFGAVFRYLVCVVC